MQKLQGIFELYGFFRCHQSFLVRLDAMQGVYLDETRKCHKILLFGTEEQISLSRGKYPELRERVRRALPLCVIWGALFAITPRTGWQLALIVPLFFLLGAAVWLLLRPPLLYAAAAADVLEVRSLFLQNQEGTAEKPQEKADQTPRQETAPEENWIRQSGEWI